MQELNLSEQDALMREGTLPSIIRHLFYRS